MAKTQNAKSLSIITSVYQTEEYLEACFDNVRTQYYENYEFIVVNDGSGDRCKEIIENYQKKYTEFKVIYVNKPKNEGLFHARLSGIEAATGDYIAFFDNDDTLSKDFYGSLIRHAEKTNSDIVAADTILLMNDKIQHTFNPLNNLNFELKGGEILDALLYQRGYCYYWHTVWNKVYKRELVEKALPQLKKMRKGFTMCEDILFSILFFRYATKFTNIHNNPYYYNKRAGSATDNTNDYSKYARHVADIRDAFYFADSILTEERHKLYFEDWKNTYYNIWHQTIQNSSLTKSKRNRLFQEISTFTGGSKLLNVRTVHAYYAQQTTFTSDVFDALKEKIADESIKYVSFDVFDTLILRPFWEPTDLFLLMNKEFNTLLPDCHYIDFRPIRVAAEERTRLEIAETTGYEEITLDEIYSTLVLYFNIPQNIAERLKASELRLEKEFCCARKIALELYEFALSLGKKVICISDMYLNAEQIRGLLDGAGYKKIDNLYVSSEFRITKHSGAIYRHILQDLSIKPCHIIHIGDNWCSDVEMPKKQKIAAYFLPKTGDVFRNNTSNYAGESYQNIFHNLDTAEYNGSLSFLSVRSMLQLVANKFFDYPYVSYKPESDFNGNPYYIGYYALGMYIYGLLRWLIDGTKGKYSTIHFISRDGWLLKEAYDVYCEGKNDLPASNMLYISRKSAAPLLAGTAHDLLLLELSINPYKHSPERVVELLKEIISPENYKNAKAICEKNGFAWTKKFIVKVNYDSFILFFMDRLYDQKIANGYRDLAKTYFQNKIGSRDCTFDVGYSARGEMIISKLLGVNLDAFFININTQQAYSNASKSGVNIHLFRETHPKVNGVVREAFLSSLGPSCIGYSANVNGNVEPVFEKVSDYQPVNDFISCVQKGALDFIRDATHIFGKYEKDFFYLRYNDATLPYEYYINHGKIFDRSILNTMVFEDDISAGKIDVVDFWSNQMLGVNQSKEIYISGWQGYVHAMMFDRGALKQKISEKMTNHPFALRLMKKIYRLARDIKRRLT